MTDEPIPLRDRARPSNIPLRVVRKRGPGKGGRQRGGKKVGTLNRATIEKELRAEMERAERTGKAPAVQRLAEIMQFFFALMGRHQPRYDESGAQIGGSLEETYRAADMAVRCAIPLAQYQSAKQGSLTPAATPNVEGDNVTMTVNIFDAEGGMIRSVTTAPKLIEGTVEPVEGE